MVVYGVMALVDILALSIGMGVIFVALLSWERSGIRWLRDLAFVLLAGTVLLILDLLRLYEIAAGWPPGAAGRVVLAGLGGTGNLLLAFAVPKFVDGIAPLPKGRIPRMIRLTIMAIFVLAGVLDETFDIPAFHVFNDVMMAVLLLPTAVLLAIGCRRIAEPDTRAMVGRLMWLTIASVVLSRGQLVVTSHLGIALELRRVRIVPVFYYLGVLTVMLMYSVKHLFRPASADDFLLSREFADLHGISKREGEIITMIVQGHANRVIGERLFISDRTVKNHISSIYRKTGAGNKVQLMNMVRNTPGVKAGPGEGGAVPPGRDAST